MTAAARRTRVRAYARSLWVPKSLSHHAAANIHVSSPAKENQQMSITPAPHYSVALKTGLAAVLALATALTAWRPDWIEALGLGNPDGGSGALELAILVVLGIATAITATWAWRAWARLMSMNA